jgi:hypothetical protein
MRGIFVTELWQTKMTILRKGGEVIEWVDMFILVLSGGIFAQQTVLN